MRIRMKGQMSGTRNEVDWPPPGACIDLPDDEALSLIASGMAEPCPKAKAKAEAPVETAVAPAEDVEARPAPAKPKPKRARAKPAPMTKANSGLYPEE